MTLREMNLKGSTEKKENKMNDNNFINGKYLLKLKKKENAATKY